MRKMRKQPNCQYNPWNMKLEPGMRVFDPRPLLGCAYIYDLVESNGRNKRDIGELTPKLCKKYGVPRHAIMDDNGIWYWDN